MTARTFVELFEPPVRLSVHPVPGGYTVQDQHGHAYVLAPSPLTFCLKFMTAMAQKKDAVIDDASVERATWFSSSEPGPGLPGRIAADPKAQGATRAPVSLAATPHSEPAPGSETFSRAVMADVIPIRKEA